MAQLIYKFDKTTGILNISGSGTRVTREDICNAVGPISYSNSDTTLKQVKFSDATGITTIGKDAFTSCDGLTSITLPPTVISIESYAFGYCYYLTTVIFPESLTSIEYNAFESCDLESIILPASLKTVEREAFMSCHKLINVTCLAVLEPKIGSSVFYCGNVEGGKNEIFMIDK